MHGVITGPEEGRGATAACRLCRRLSQPENKRDALHFKEGRARRAHSAAPQQALQAPEACRIISVYKLGGPVYVPGGGICVDRLYGADCDEY